MDLTQATPVFDLNNPIIDLNLSLEEPYANVNDVATNNSEKDVCVERFDDPKVGMCFESSAEFWMYCQNYAKQEGFQYAIRNSERLDEVKKKKDGGKLNVDTQVDYSMYKRLRLGCTRAGHYKSKARSPNRKKVSQAYGCVAKIDASLSNGVMKVKALELRHNHELDPSRSRFMVNYRMITTSNKKRIINNDNAGVPPIKNFTSLVVENGGYLNVKFNESDCINLLKNERRRSRLNGDAVALEEYFKKMMDDNPQFFYAIDEDDDGRLRNVFWADARSRAAFKDFGDVVTFDTTHLINKYRMPFAPFIGINHHGSSIILGAGLMTNENCDSFVWLFNQWKLCMGGLPNAILTDQCKAIGKAIKIAFPKEVKHRLCLSHILQNAERNLGKLSMWKGISDKLRIAVYDSLTLGEFENAWMEMVDKFGLHNNEWIKEIYSIRHDWVPGYWRDTFWAGMSSTQRSEGMNFFFKGYININTGLRQFVQQYDLCLARKVEAETKLTSDSWERPLFCNKKATLAEEVFHKAYTNNKFKEFQEEVQGLAHVNASKLSADGCYDVTEVITNPIWKSKWKSFKVSINKTEGVFKCSCQLFEFTGILCRHILRGMQLEKVNFIPETYIKNRWRKNVMRDYEKIKLHYYDPETSQHVEDTKK